MDSLLKNLFSLHSSPGNRPVSLLDWWGAREEQAAGSTSPFELAAMGGFQADRLGFAFAAGYHAALRALVPSLPHGVIASLCATEAQGAHPRAIRTQFTPLGGDVIIRGEKRWATCAALAEVLVIIGTTGTDDQGRNRLNAALVDARAPGVEILPMATPPFAPEIPHAVVRLQDVRIPLGQVLAGDGYDDFLKPFRTVEDLYVMTGLAGYLLGVSSRRGWPAPIKEELIATLWLARALAEESPRSAWVHIGLAGLIAGITRLIPSIEEIWRSSPDQELDRWERDKLILGVAGNAREKRREAAWRHVGQGT
ncbi:MAG: acyl-CoA dehydrogenase family protein [Deltaproteobacteria bacterium]|nr:acyl-CoA dehydrogenase family protein [Deltaproteobacteria bacterium]